MVRGSDESLNAAVDEIVRVSHPQKVILFGSRARGDHHDESDFDLMVVADRVDHQFRDTLAVKRVVAPLLDADVVLVDQDRWEDRRQIAGTVYYDADEQGRVLYVR